MSFTIPRGGAHKFFKVGSDRVFVSFERHYAGLAKLELELVQEDSWVLRPSLLRLHAILGIRVRPAEDTTSTVDCDNAVSLCNTTPEKTLTKCKELIAVRRHATREDGVDRTDSEVAFLETIADLFAAVRSGQRVHLLNEDATLVLGECLTFVSSLVRGFP